MWKAHCTNSKENSSTNRVIIVMRTQLEQLFVCAQQISESPSKKKAEDLVYVYTNSKLMAKAKAKDDKKWYNENVSSEDSDSASEDEDGDDWMVNDASDDDGCADVTLDDPMDDWIQVANEERPETLSRYGKSSKDVYDFVDDGEGGNHV